jgi:hypothetical protein
MLISSSGSGMSAASSRAMFRALEAHNPGVLSQ